MTEDSSTAWKDPNSDVNWLRDFLPECARIGRVIAYGYDRSSVRSFLGSDGLEHIYGLAVSLVQNLQANRQYANALRRPIIFICHGLGGVLVKKSLLYSSNCLAPKVDHLYDQYTSTFAILFFGTPHGKTSLKNWLALERRSSLAAKLKSMARGADNTHHTNQETCQIPKSIDDEFVHLRKRFHLFFFWEELPTDLGDRSDWVVARPSAAPSLDDTEHFGIHATHSQMVKFASKKSPDYRTVIDAIERYCSKAPDIISQRWRYAEDLLEQRTEGEVRELGGLGVNIHSSHRLHHHAAQFFDPPRPRMSHFIGRQDIVELIGTKFFQDGVAASSWGLKYFVVYGIGGSGKTQCCSEYAHQFRKR